MQTFLPFPSFRESVKSLDWRRLGKQRVEAKQILQTLEGTSKGWASHPAVKMWRGSESALAMYGFICCEEWRRRGYRDTLTDFFVQRVSRTRDWLDKMPKWIGDERFHSAHRAALLKKDPKWYGQFGWSEEPKIEYFWPTKGGYR